jgi:hypothetical protein
MSQPDPVIGRGCLVLLGALFGLVPRPQVPVAAPVWHSGGRAASGCLWPGTATASDWRTIPGVHRRLAAGLEQHCRGSGHCGPGLPLPALSGLGPATAGRVLAALCRQAPADIGTASEVAQEHPAHGDGDKHSSGCAGAPTTRAAW